VTLQPMSAPPFCLTFLFLFPSFSFDFATSTLLFLVLGL
jgi:hypothetical protein